MKFFERPIDRHPLFDVQTLMKLWTISFLTQANRNPVFRFWFS